jgi:diaminopimelate dehydrogenase
VAVVGYGRLGCACVDALLSDSELVLAGVVRAAAHAQSALPAPHEQVAVTADPGELGRVDAALVCVPTECVRASAHDLLQHRIPIVECATLHGEAFEAHRGALHQMAIRFSVPAVVGAGWDPGALSLLRALFALLAPQGHTELTHHPGIHVHHSTVASAMPGVRKALSLEQTDPSGRPQRYVYVELEQDSDRARVERTIREDPLFAGEDTLVFPMESVGPLEDEGHGVLLERRTPPGPGHPQLLFEARCSQPRLAARVMVAAARALPACSAGAHGLLDLPLARCFGRDGERVWI